MLYRLLTVDQAAALPRAEYERLVFPNDACLLPAIDEERDAALGFVTRSGGWNAASWESVANDPLLYAHRPGLVIHARDIAAEMRRQEAEHEVS